MLLIDTHILLWLLESPEKISTKALAKLVDTNIKVFLSPVTIWEIGIKIRLGKLKLHVSLDAIIAICEKNYQFIELPVTIPHVHVASELPNIHKDPFDRLLIAQAKSEKLSFVTQDKIIQKYTVPILW